MAIVLTFLSKSGVPVEPVSTFVLDRDDFLEANKVCDTGYRGGSQWRGTFKEDFCCNIYYNGC